MEYVVLVLIALAVAGGLVWWSSTSDSEPARVSAEVAACRDVPAVTQQGGRCSTASALLTFYDDQSSATVGAVRIRPVQTTLDRAQTASGRRRNRARLTAQLEVTNLGSEPARVRPSQIYISAGGDRVLADPATRRDSGSVMERRSLAPGQTRIGILRFELAGGQTSQVVREDSALLGVRDFRPAGEGARQEIAVLRLAVPRD